MSRAAHTALPHLRLAQASPPSRISAHPLRVEVRKRAACLKIRARMKPSPRGSPAPSQTLATGELETAKAPESEAALSIAPIKQRSPQLSERFVQEGPCALCCRRPRSGPVRTRLPHRCLAGPLSATVRENVQYCTPFII